MVTTPNEKVGEEFREKARWLSPQEVRELSKLDPFQSTLSIAVNWLWLFLCVAAAVKLHALIPLAIVGVALGQHGLAVLAHEAAHYRIYETRWLNDLAGKLCAMPLGLSMLTYRVIHRIHHNHLYEPIDPDLALMAGYPRGRWYLIRKLLKDLSGVTIIKSYSYFRGRPQGQKLADDTSSQLKLAARRERKIILAFHLTLLAAMIVTGLWKWYLALWLIPALTVLQMILRLRAVCEHGAVPELTTPLRAARTTLAPFWVRCLLFPHHVNHHIEHHLYPSVPHYRLAECHRRLAKTGALDNAEVVPSIGVTFGKIFRAETA
jgi:fatty acid desaturase